MNFTLRSHKTGGYLKHR